LLSVVALVVLFVLYFWTLYNIPILAVGVWNLRRSGCKGRSGRRFSSVKRGGLPFVSIIVPVKNEEKVVGRLLDALLRLNYPADKMEIIVVEDGSVDGTVEICRDFVRRFPGQVRLVRRMISDGKPSALNYGLRFARGKIVGVFDADNVPEPDTLLKVVEYFRDSSVAAVQGRACSINADLNMLTKFLAYEEAVRYETYIRGKDVLNLFVPLTGSCYFIRRDVLVDVNGWDEKSLSEDVEMALRLTERGYRVKYAPEIRSWQENPESLFQLVKQRVRWFRGEMEMTLKYGRLAAKPNWVNIDAEMTLAGPFMFIFCLVGYLMFLWVLFTPFQHDFIFVAVSQMASLATLFPLFVIGLALIYVTKPRKALNLLWLPFIYAYWGLQTFLALYAFLQIVFRRPRKWTKTVKTGVATCLDFRV